VKDIGLVGVQFSGKSTLFTALTRTGGHGGQANHAVVPVPDPRVDVLTQMEHSRKTVHAQVGFVDVPGGTASAQGIAKLREAFPDLPDKLDPRTVFLKLRELRNKW